MSMLSLAPAARMLGCTGLTASPGSFCLFCENSASLLPTVTSVEPPGVSGAAPASTDRRRIVMNAAAVAPARRVVRMTPPVRRRMGCAGARQPSLEPVEAPRHADAAHARRMNLPNSEDLKRISADGGERMRTQHTTRPVRPLRAWFVKRVAVPAELDIISCADAAAWDAWLA